MIRCNLLLTLPETIAGLSDFNLSVVTVLILRIGMLTDRIAPSSVGSCMLLTVNSACGPALLVFHLGYAPLTLFVLPICLKTYRIAPNLAGDFISLASNSACGSA